MTHLGQDSLYDLQQLVLLDRVVRGSHIDLDEVELGTAINSIGLRSRARGGAATHSLPPCFAKSLLLYVRILA